MIRKTVLLNLVQRLTGNSSIGAEKHAGARKLCSTWISGFVGTDLRGVGTDFRDCRYGSPWLRVRIFGVAGTDTRGYKYGFRGFTGMNFRSYGYGFPQTQRRISGSYEGGYPGFRVRIS